METSHTVLSRIRLSHGTRAASHVARAALLVLTLLCAACSTTPHRNLPSEQPTSVLAQVAQTARSQVGAPYHYGGETPRGFDCSGLVFYAYGESGVRVPRTSDEQLRAARPLALEQAVPGDLLFFRTKEKGLHVGIYLGDEHFVHAPSTGKTVVVSELEQEYYRRHLVKIGRIN